MPLDRTEIEKIAHLARLAIDAEDIPNYTKELSRILDFVAAMSTADTTGITPMAHPLDAVARLREDRVTETNQRDTFQAIAPKVDRGLYLVPKVIE